jgi:hypothetical protein
LSFYFRASIRAIVMRSYSAVPAESDTHKRPILLMARGVLGINAEPRARKA